MKEKPSVAIVHDWLYGGGAELVVEQLHKMYPDAPIYTSYCSDEWRERLDHKVVTGYLQKWPFAQLRKFLPLLRQYWFKRLNLDAYDLVISSTGNGEAKFVTVKETAKHICYCHTPVHFYWQKYNEYLQNPGFRPKWLVRMGLRILVNPLRKRDYEAAQRVDHFIANSSHIQKDIKKYYGRESIVIHPPVEINNFRSQSPVASLPAKSGYVVWGRHVPYKRFDIVIEACNQLKLPLTVIGVGPQTEALKAIAGPTVTFAGFATRENLIRLARGATAFIFSSEEDFGISPVEAQALGLPVIAYKAGGALDYMQPGVNGTFFEEQTVESLMATLKKFDPSMYYSKKIIKTASAFEATEFRQKTAAYLKVV